MINIHDLAKECISGIISGLFLSITTGIVTYIFLRNREKLNHISLGTIYYKMRHSFFQLFTAFKTNEKESKTIQWIRNYNSSEIVNYKEKDDYKELMSKLSFINMWATRLENRTISFNNLYFRASLLLPRCSKKVADSFISVFYELDFNMNLLNDKTKEIKAIFNRIEGFYLYQDKIDVDYFNKYISGIAKNIEWIFTKFVSKQSDIEKLIADSLNTFSNEFIDSYKKEEENSVKKDSLDVKDSNK